VARINLQSQYYFIGISLPRVCGYRFSATQESGNRDWAQRLLVILQSIVEENVMLWTIAVILTLLWLLGFVSSYTMGGFIHILLVVAIVVVLVRAIQGRQIV